MTASVGAVAAQATAADAATQQAGVQQVAPREPGVQQVDPQEAGVQHAAPQEAGTQQAGTRQGATQKAAAKLSKAAKQRIKATTAVTVARKQIGDPYRYGASGPHAFDCSGLVMFSWRKAGVKLPRIAASQYRSIKKKISWKNLKPGDLMFFRGLGHVGMYVGKGKMIHSPNSGSRVRVDKLSGYRKSSFVGAVRPGM
ncbi:C40 family peptidase [Sphaerisporangium sp. TRM90804]|uniref:C40 family peptidase n=1 Tax=Sphaerisporangium sp. TRM90804 TaxID=3031113 RepID=UPI002449BAB3|nr:C40 family peptidase [Sphaerisporangium sp. TRM90804]MDH2424556.1 C40 family peptidase [Sphaerisporangium sp. TRM90804]